MMIFLYGSYDMGKLGGKKQTSGVIYESKLTNLKALVLAHYTHYLSSFPGLFQLNHLLSPSGLLLFYASLAANELRYNTVCLSSILHLFLYPFLVFTSWFLFFLFSFKKKHHGLLIFCSNVKKLNYFLLFLFRFIYPVVWFLDNSLWKGKIVFKSFLPQCPSFSSVNLTLHEEL